ncbi:PhoH family protein [Candidatus Margulisiibacteriota bacterium]
MKYFILDTNVLLHNPQAIYSFADNTVVIPITVIEELDTFKTSPDKKGMHARTILREIDALIKKGALEKGATMKNEGRLLIHVLANISDKLKNLDSSVHDNKILSVALELQDEEKTVFFISKDVNARIKAEALGIKAKDYEKEKVEYDSLYRGWKEITVPKTDIDKLFSDNQLHLNQSLKVLTNEHILLKATDDEQSSALCNYLEDEDTLIPIKKTIEAMGITPLNMEQLFAFNLLLDDNIKIVTLVGKAGTGKTLIALACGLSRVLAYKSIYEKLLVARPIIPMGKDIGYLPGTKDKKLTYWMQPIFDNLHFIMHTQKKKEKENKTSYLSYSTVDQMMDSKILEIEALTYIRGRSIPNQYIIIDEVQNLTPHEVKTIVSRAGEGTKIILTGDPEQIDNPYLDANSNGLSYVSERFKGHKITGHIFLSKTERSELATLATVLL